MSRIQKFIILELLKHQLFDRIDLIKLATENDA